MMFHGQVVTRGERSEFISGVSGKDSTNSGEPGVGNVRGLSRHLNCWKVWRAKRSSPVEWNGWSFASAILRPLQINICPGVAVPCPSPLPRAKPLLPLSITYSAPGHLPPPPLPPRYATVDECMVTHQEMPNRLSFWILFLAEFLRSAFLVDFCSSSIWTALRSLATSNINKWWQITDRAEIRQIEKNSVL